MPRRTARSSRRTRPVRVDSPGSAVEGDAATATIATARVDAGTDNEPLPARTRQTRELEVSDDHADGQDADIEDAEPAAGEPAADSVKEEEEEEEEEDEEDEEQEQEQQQEQEETEPAQAGDDGEDEAAEAGRTGARGSGGGRGLTARGRRRPGRLPKSRSSILSVDEIASPGAAGSTPPRRKRGRPALSNVAFSGAGRLDGAAGGFRGRVRSAVAAQLSRVPIDKDGTMADVVDDEVDLPEDREGETKVDRMGTLLGGRDYRVRVFTIVGRGRRLYMLSTEPARCTGFRDSYLFFAKHMRLFKVIIDETEKRDLIERDIIPHSYKGRAIGVVTARSVFREFGARIVVGGRRITDDYYVQSARERGHVEGELADPADRIPQSGEAYNKNHYVAWHGASSVYHSNAPAPMALLSGGKLAPGSKRRISVTSANWQVEHARAASQYNSSITAARKASLAGVYDSHTNLMFNPQILQPTHALWEDAISAQRRRLSSPSLSPSFHRTEPCDDRFRVVPAAYESHLIVDTYMKLPPFSGLGPPGPDHSETGLSPDGLPAVNVDEFESVEENCKDSYMFAKSAQQSWKRIWDTEKTDGLRCHLQANIIGIPV